MSINNFYNFKNTIRHFINIDEVIYPDINDFTIANLSYTEPIKFRIRKNVDGYRTLKIPNILNFKCLYEKVNTYEHFRNPNNFDSHKRLVPNVETGDFGSGKYSARLKEDFRLLSVYDNLIKLDIKSFYGRIYAHHIEFENRGDEKYLTNLNFGNTNGLIMSNYISLYFAEKYLKDISNKIKNNLNSENIDCDFSYFSDDFYFFCNRKDNNSIINIFDRVLEEQDLERNSSAIEIWEYMEYNNYHLLEKYWKKIISNSRFRFDQDKNDNNLYFINQLIYRMQKLNDDRQRRIFLITFFKSTYFHKIDINKYEIEDYNFHQICYMYRFCPEIILYTLNKFKENEYFRSQNFKKFLRVRYKESLESSYNEEQLYYYYAIKTLEDEDILKDNIDLIMKSKNQILISYYLKDGIFKEEEINKLKEYHEEQYWFQNYHLILYTDLKDNLDDSIIRYLFPKQIRERLEDRNNFSKAQRSYLEFYKLNLESNKKLIQDIREINNDVNSYIELKIREREHEEE